MISGNTSDNDHVKATGERCECETSVASVCMCCDNVTKRKKHESFFDKLSSRILSILKHIHKYMVLQCSKLFYSKVSNGFLRQDLQSYYSFGKIQNVVGPELSEEKN